MAPSKKNYSNNSNYSNMRHTQIAPVLEVKYTYEYKDPVPPNSTKDMIVFELDYFAGEYN